MMLTIGVINVCFLSQNLQNSQNPFAGWKAANRRLSGGEAVAEPHPVNIEVLHCFEGFVIIYTRKSSFFSGMIDPIEAFCIFVTPNPRRQENTNPLKMKTVKVLDKEFGLYIPQEKIEASIQKVADQINHDLDGMNPLFLVVLNGAFMFASELFKRLTIPCEISFVKLTSYSGTKSTNVIRELIGLDNPLDGRHVVVVEDIVDTGHTMRHTLKKLRDLKASDVRIATLFFKPNSFQYDYPIDYKGMDIGNEFIVGYGLDYEQYGRNLPDIYKIIE